MMRMNSLVNFPPPAEAGLITICEWENHLIALSPAASTGMYTDLIKNYPKVSIPGALRLTPQMSKESAREAFIQQNASTWTRARSSWHERGFRGMLEELSDDQEQNGWVPILARSGLSLLNWTSVFPFPFWQVDDEQVINEYIKTANWNQSVIRSFAWHSQCTKFAIAFGDDSVRVYSAITSVVPTLKHKSQKEVTDLAWMPFSTSILTIACRLCILVWQVDPASLMTRPPAGCVQILEHPGHSPIISISWNPYGTLLLSGAPKDSRMRVWDIGLEESQAILRYSSGVTLALWSPDAEFIFTAAPGPTFKIWETKTWTCETWSKLAGPCQTACWHPSSSVLLFTTKNETVIYSVNFSESQNESCNTDGVDAVNTIANVASVSFKVNDDLIEIGGKVQSMDWDPTGERLALTFSKKSANKGVQKYVAVFRTRIKPFVELTPCGFIQGDKHEIPQLISFEKKYEHGALLAVCWTNELTGAGRVGYIPMQFLPAANLNKSNLTSSPYTNSPFW